MKRKTHKEFIEELLLINPDLKIVGEYKGLDNRILVKNIYGICNVKALTLMHGSCGSIKTAIDKTSYWIKMAREVHGDKYDYSKVEYKLKQSKMKIGCKAHGLFNQRGDNHLQGKGCPKCIITLNCFKLSHWKQMCPGNPGTFYILRCWNDNEEFYKVGITCQDSVDKRYSTNPIPYNYEIVKQIVDNNRERIWQLEKHYLSLLKEYHYKPLIKFGGSTKECIKLNNNEH